MADSTSPLSYSIPLSRLLARLESSLGDQEKLKSLNEVELRKAAANIDNARKLVIQLERSEGPGKPDPNTIALQRKRILELYHQVSLAQQAQANIEEPEEEEEEDDLAAKPTDPTTSDLANEPISSLREKLFTNRETAAADTSTDHVLQHHRMLQDDLSDAMLGMARGLKQRTIAFGEALKEDSKVIENATTALTRNAEGMTKTGARLGQYSQTSRGMTWLIIGAIVAVFVAWLLMYFIIRLSSILPGSK